MPIVGIGFLAQRKRLAAPGSTPKNFLLQPVSAQTDQPLSLLFLLRFCLKTSPGTAPEQQPKQPPNSPLFCRNLLTVFTVIELLFCRFLAAVSAQNYHSKAAPNQSQISPLCYQKNWIKTETNGGQIALPIRVQSGGSEQKICSLP